MKVDNEDIEQVLALFDDEDRPYINIDYLIEKNPNIKVDETINNTKIDILRR